MNGLDYRNKGKCRLFKLIPSEKILGCKHDWFCIGVEHYKKFNTSYEVQVQCKHCKSILHYDIKDYNSNKNHWSSLPTYSNKRVHYTYNRHCSHVVAFLLEQNKTECYLKHGKFLIEGELDNIAN